MIKNLKIPMSIKNQKFDYIKIGELKVNSLNYMMPGDISSSAFLVLTILSENSELTLEI